MEIGKPKSQEHGQTLLTTTVFTMAVEYFNNCHVSLESVIGDKSGYPVTNLCFLKQLHTYCF